ncbi:MAG: hypothetical protein OSB19_18440 [Opitutaceae bacterium]|nr:hypothetical protein [Opitutaceae bacterium]
MIVGAEPFWVALAETVGREAAGRVEENTGESGDAQETRDGVQVYK